MGLSTCEGGVYVCVGVQDMRQRLAAAWDVHTAGGCGVEPWFCQEASFGGPPALFLHCDVCQLLHVVM